MPINVRPKEFSACLRIDHRVRPAAGELVFAKIEADVPAPCRQVFDGHFWRERNVGIDGLMHAQELHGFISERAPGEERAQFSLVVL